MRRRNNRFREVVSWVLTVALAVAAALLINEYVIAKVVVPTGSMENTIQVNDQLLCFRLAYLLDDPKRGDVVIFPWPDNPEETYVKRIIGLPGETVEIKNGAVYIDGEYLPEPYLPEVMHGSYGPYEVPENCYFMMGDNRNSSADSRRWENTYLKREDIVAKVLFRYKPDFEWFEDIVYEMKNKG